MGDLPSARVLPVNRPFTKCGVDFAGPISLKAPMIRSSRAYKAYIALFVCLSTRAIHLELVTALTTDAFLATLTRFAARRGLPSDIYSDQGTNFVGAANEMAAILKKNELQDDVSARGVNWHFNPPSAPHFGGLWEAGVRSVKTHLRRVVGTSVLTYEEYNTVLCRTEAILNSRPLLPMSSDPNDLSVLTPAYFLIGEPLSAPPEPDFASDHQPTLRRWQLVQKLSQDLWKRWSHEYLTRLQQRPKWWRKAPNLTPGRLVLIQDPNRAPLEWRMGRITAVHPGPDGIVRVATLHTAFGEVQRPVAKLCPLPLDGADQDLDPDPDPDPHADQDDEEPAAVDEPLAANDALDLPIASRLRSRKKQ